MTIAAIAAHRAPSPTLAYATGLFLFILTPGLILAAGRVRSTETET